jgi:hypothetical protein
VCLCVCVRVCACVCVCVCISSIACARAPARPRARAPARPPARALARQLWCAAAALRMLRVGPGLVALRCALFAAACRAAAQQRAARPVQKMGEATKGLRCAAGGPNKGAAVSPLRCVRVRVRLDGVQCSAGLRGSDEPIKGSGKRWHVSDHILRGLDCPGVTT